jgi:RNA polymerase sigma factor (sigma-70 family)
VKIREQDIPRLIIEGKESKVFEYLYQKVYPLVKNYIKKNSGIAEDADDVFQDALLVFYKQVKGNQFDEKYKVFGYVYKISVNRWLNKINKDKRIQLEEDISELDQKNIEFERIDNSNDTKKQDIIVQLFKQLGEKCEEIMSLTTYYDLSIEDIQHRLEMKSEGSVKMQLKRCRDKLVELLKEKPELISLLKEN